jgi:hypothetical protein
VAPGCSGRCAGDAGPPGAERALTAIAEHLDHGRRDTARTNEIKRSCEDASRKQRALELICAARATQPRCDVRGIRARLGCPVAREEGTPGRKSYQRRRPARRAFLSGQRISFFDLVVDPAREVGAREPRLDHPLPRRRRCVATAISQPSRLPSKDPDVANRRCLWRSGCVLLSSHGVYGRSSAAIVCRCALMCAVGLRGSFAGAGVLRCECGLPASPRGRVGSGALGTVG